MDKKKLFIIIGVLAVLLILETGYLIGKNTAVTDAGFQSDYPVQSRSLLNSTKPDYSVRRSVPDVRTRADDLEEWDPFREMHNMQTMMNRSFNNSFSRARRMNIFDTAGILGSSFDPDIDVREQDDSYVIVVDLPGVNKDSINVNVSQNSITISGERQIEREEKDGVGGFYRAERSFGSFSRTIPFQHRIVPGEVTAETTEGVLIVNIPKEKPGYEEEEKGINISVR